MNLDTYIEDEWLWFPTNKINTMHGLQFVMWLKENDEDEYEMLMDNTYVNNYKDSLFLSATCCNPEDPENTRKLAEQYFRDSLIKAIEEYMNCREENTQEEDDQAEGESYDRQRLM